MHACIHTLKRLIVRGPRNCTTPGTVTPPRNCSPDPQNCNPPDQKLCKYCLCCHLSSQGPALEAARGQSISARISVNYGWAIASYIINTTIHGTGSHSQFKNTYSSTYSSHINLNSRPSSSNALGPAPIFSSSAHRLQSAPHVV